MNDKEKADCLIELHKVQMDHFRQTRELEIKVNIALWTAIILAGHFLLKSNINFAGFRCLIYLIIGAGVFLGHLILWMIPIQKSEETDISYIKPKFDSNKTFLGLGSNKIKPLKAQKS